MSDDETESNYLLDFIFLPEDKYYREENKKYVKLFYMPVEDTPLMINEKGAISKTIFKWKLLLQK